LLAAPARAQYPDLTTPSNVDKSGEQDAALVFAVGDYAFLPKIGGVDQTATEWEGFFENGLGIPETRVFVRRNRQVTREKMLAFVKKAAKSVEDDGRLWVVFVGHGAPSDAGGGLLLGMDAQPDIESVKARGISRNELSEAIRSHTSNEVIWVLDACFSGKTRNGESLTNAQPLVPTEAVDFEPDASMTVLAAADSTEYAGPLPGSDRPAFSYVVLAGLRGWADDGDGKLRADEVVNYAREHLQHLSHSQTPALQGSNSVLVSGAEEEDPGLINVFQSGGKAPPKPRRESAKDISSERTHGRTSTAAPSVPEATSKPAGRWLREPMEAVCRTEPKIEGNTVRCDHCPMNASAGDGELVAVHAYTGAFSEPSAEEMILATKGCGGGFNFKDSAVLLRKTGGEWHQVEYKDTFPVDDCKPVAAGPRGMLLCRSLVVGQGAADITIKLVSATAGGGFAWYEAAEFFDGTAGCFYTPDHSLNGAFKHDVKQMFVDDIDADGRYELAILFTEHVAKPKGDAPVDKRCDKSRYDITITNKAKILELGNGQYRENPGGLEQVEDSRVTEFLE
jgi:hypothetical protein